MKTIEEIWSIVNGLKELYPDGVCSLDYRKDYELLFSVRLAAQCTDERVNKVTPALYARFPTLEALAEADTISQQSRQKHNRRLFSRKKMNAPVYPKSPSPKNCNRKKHNCRAFRPHSVSQFQSKRNSR